MASWPSSEKACPWCKVVGHDSHSCPRRPTPKKSKKRNSPSSQRTRTTPATPTSSSTIAIPATADTADMDEDTPTSKPILFPFELTPEQALNLNNLTPEQWIKHCQNVRSNHPRNEPAIDNFLSLPIEDIVNTFHDAVEHLVASSTPPTDPSPTPSTSSTSPTSPFTLPTTDIPPCRIDFTPELAQRYRGYADRQFLNMAKGLKNRPDQKDGPVKEFLYAHPIELVAVSIKRAVLAALPPPQQ